MRKPLKCGSLLQPVSILAGRPISDRLTLKGFFASGRRKEMRGSVRAHAQVAGYTRYLRSSVQFRDLHHSLLTNDKGRFG